MISAFLDEHLTWFSVEDYPEDHEVVAVGFGTEEGLPSERLEQKDGLLRRAIADLADVREYALSVDVRRELNFPEETVPECVPPGARCLIYVHDDCFAGIPNPSAEVLGKVVGAVLDLHRFYLGLAVDWSSVLDGVVALMKSPKNVRLRSDPERQNPEPELEAGKRLVSQSAAGMPSVRCLRQRGPLHFKLKLSERTARAGENRHSGTEQSATKMGSGASFSLHRGFSRGGELKFACTLKRAPQLNRTGGLAYFAVPVMMDRNFESKDGVARIRTARRPRAARPKAARGPGARIDQTGSACARLVLLRLHQSVSK